MKTIFAILVLVCFWSRSNANSPGPSEASLPESKSIPVEATLKKFALESGVLKAAIGTDAHFDALTFTVDVPEKLKGRTFVVWVSSPDIPRSKAGRKTADDQWHSCVGLQIHVEVDDRVFTQPDVVPCALICPMENLEFRKPDQTSTTPSPTGGRG